MEQHYWFGITCSFVCPRCNKASSDKMGVSSTTSDPAKINRKLTHQKLCCEHCRFLIPDGTAVTADVKSGTLESLRKEGFPFPIDN